MNMFFFNHNGTKLSLKVVSRLKYWFLKRAKVFLTLRQHDLRLKHFIDVFFFIRCRKMCFLPFPFSRRYFFVPNLWPMMIIDFYRIIIRRIFEESFLSAAILSNYRIMMEWVCTRYIPLHIVGWKKATSIFYGRHFMIPLDSFTI